MSQKTWADRNAIPTGVTGERYRGILIDEKNRATVFAKSDEDVQQLVALADNSYTKKGVKAVVFGVHRSPTEIAYAVYVKDGFLTNG